MPNCMKNTSVWTILFEDNDYMTAFQFILSKFQQAYKTKQTAKNL